MTLGTLTGSGFGFVFWLVVAKLYSPSDVGVGAAYLSGAVLVASWADLGLSTTLVRFGATGKAALVSLLNSALSTVAIGGAVFATLVAAVAGAFAGELRSLWQIAPMAAFIAAGASLAAVQLSDRAFVALEASHFSLARIVTSNVMRIAAIVILGPGFGPIAMLLALIVGSLAGLVLGLALWTSKLLPGYVPRFELRMDVLRPVLTYSAVSHVGNLLWAAPRLVYPLLVVAWLGPSANAEFYVAWMVANLLLIVPSASSSALLARWSAESLLDVWKLVRSSVAVGMLLIPPLIIMLIVSPLLLEFFGPAYEGSTRYVSILLFSVFPFAINSLAVAYYRVAYRPVWASLIAAFVCVFCVGASAILVAPLGLYGVCLGWLLGQLAGAIVVTISIVPGLMAPAASAGR